MSVFKHSLTGPKKRIKSILDSQPKFPQSLSLDRQEQAVIYRQHQRNCSDNVSQLKSAIQEGQTVLSDWMKLVDSSEGKKRETEESEYVKMVDDPMA